MRAKCTDKFREIAQFYAKFAKYSNLDFSEQALQNAYEAETYGTEHDLSTNGYAFGKKSLNITITAWKEDLEVGLITKHDLITDYEEGSFAREYVYNAIQGMTPGTFFGWIRK